MTFKWVDINCAMGMTAKRPSDRKTKRRFPQYKNIDECPLELQPDYLDDLYHRSMSRSDFDVRDFIEFMKAVGEMPRH